jgi:endonuclease IV
MKFGLDSRVLGTYENTYKYFIDNEIPTCQLMVGKDIKLYDLVKSKKLLIENPNFYTCFHGNITYNLAGSTDGNSDPQYGRKLGNCKSGLLRELDIATFLDVGVVVHIGTQKDKDTGLKTIANTINELLITETSDTYSYSRHSQIGLKEFRDKRKIILENSARKGNQLGHTLEEISFLMGLINPSLLDNIKVCIDTCHISDAGQYNLGNIDDVDKFYKSFEESIGIKKLDCFHLNDSLNPYGSRCDRHAHLTKGHIFGGEEGTAGLKYFMNKTNQLQIPMIGEFSDGKGRDDLELVKGLFG